jgi:hypothetical protein
MLNIKFKLSKNQTTTRKWHLWFLIAIAIVGACEEFHGRDTYDIVGDGKYSFLINSCYWVGSKCLPGKTLTLYDEQHRKGLQATVINYKEIGMLVYLVGGYVDEIWFALLNTRTGEFQRDTHLNYFSWNHQKIFEELLANPLQGMRLLPVEAR